MKTSIIALLAFVSLNAFSAEFKRTALEYNKRAGTLAVYDYNPSTPTEYIVPLNDEADLALKNAKYRDCLIFTGSLENGVIFARSLKACSK